MNCQMWQRNLAAFSGKRSIYWYFPKTLLILILCEILQSAHVAAKDIKFSVNENLDSGTVLGTIDDADNFVLLTNTKGADEDFDILRLESIGVLATSAELDRERIDQYNLTFFNTSSGETYKVIVTVIDENDNRPTFAQDRITLEVSELSQVGTEFNLGSALDRDAPPFNVQGYRLVGESEYFDVNTTELGDGNTRYAQLVVISSLDRETRTFHTVTVEAFDGGIPTPNTGQMVVNVSVSDSNDNSPVFLNSVYNATIQESASVGFDVITVRATDRDAGINGDVTYSIDRTDSDPDEIFHIDSQEGRIYLNKKLDSETASKHLLTVIATDGGNQPQTGSTVVTVYVQDVNDNEPTINIIFLGSNEGKVSEGAEIGDYVARISVSDPDVGDVERFHLTMSGDDGKFGLITENDIVYLIRIQQRLDRETKPSYYITLNATDFGSPPKSASASFTIEVEDINDNAPQFDQDTYIVDISEESFPGTFVIHLTANDPDLGINSQFTFDLESTEQKEWFSLNRETGLITTTNYLDHEVNPEHRLIIKATDFGTPVQSSSATVVVRVGDTNDNPPKFDKDVYRKEVPEDTDVNSCFLQVNAVDPDFPGQPQQVSYSFSGPNAPLGKISLGVTSGQLCLTSGLDRETTSSYQFRVSATDQAGQHSSTQVYLEIGDVNDNVPLFHPLTYVANVAASTSLPGNPVTQVSATDDDDTSAGGSGFGNVTYDIVSGNTLGLFNLDNETGEIFIAKSLREFGSMVHQLRIRGVDGGGKSSESDATVTISILNGNVSDEDGPVFSQAHYVFNVEENSQSGTHVGTILATSQGQGPISYFLRSDPPMTNWFEVDVDSGDVNITSPPDREIFSSVSLQVMASSGNTPVYGFASLTIIIDDVNDNLPVFTADPPNVNPAQYDVIAMLTIPYTYPRDSVMYTVVASDADQGNNALIRFSLTDNAGFFAIGINSGEVMLMTSLPEVNRNYSITVQASDHGNPPRSSTGKIVIQALQPDRNCPVFSDDSYSVSIPENTPLAKSFFSVEATSASTVTYNLQPSIDAFSFSVFPNGSLYLTSKIDREIEDSYRIKVIAEGLSSTHFTSPCTAVATIDVTVDDVNDNFPYFFSDVYLFTVEENLPAGTVVGTVTATDDDVGENSELRYSLSVENQFFSINAETGTITTIEELDHESARSHALLVRARDNGDFPLMTQITVRVLVDDVNDNAPNFLSLPDSPVMAIVLEREPAGTFVASLMATDDDDGENGQLSYSIISGAEDSFSIDGETGVVNTARQLNVADGANYNLLVRAEDHGAKPISSTVTLQIKVRSADESAVQFDDTNYVFYVDSSKTSPGSELGRFKTEIPSNRARRSVTDDVIVLTNFYVTRGDNDDVFYLNSTSGELSTFRKLDYETQAQYNLQVTAENSGTPKEIYTFQAQINIQDVNDFAPAFTRASYAVAIEENIPIGTQIATLTAIDNDVGVNGDVIYSILNETASVVSAQPSSNVRPVFRIDPRTGELFSNEALDRERVPEYKLIVQATDESPTDPKSTTVSAVMTVKDMNDNRPRFVSDDIIYVMEDEPIGYPLGSLAAEDDDLGANSHVTYSLIRIWDTLGADLSDEGTFYLDPSTGELILMEELNYENVATFYLNVSATDNAAKDPLTSYQLLRINVTDVNDEPPRFVRSVYYAEVTENEDSGTLVTRVTANDRDYGANGKVTYELRDKSAMFSVDPASGIILTAGTLDREQQETYILTVYGHDGAFPALYDWCQVHVTVRDVNDNSPRFALTFDPVTSEIDDVINDAIEVPEYEPGPALIHTVVATDRDVGENGRISYSIEEGNTGNSFFINSSTGELWTIGRLDREETASYRLKLVATDNGTTPKRSEVFIDITVLDWNDNDPVFTEAVYSAQVLEGLDAGEYVLAVHADDSDSGPNAEITYSIDPGTREGVETPQGNLPEGLFAVDSETGVVTTTAVLDREKKSRHHLTIQATDSAPYGPRKTSVSVIIDVTDVNDNAPIFTENLVVTNLTETIDIGSEIATVEAQDKDTGDNGEVYYRITGGNTAPYGTWTNKFQIDSNGRITTTSSLSGANTYYLNVTATDNGTPSNSADAVVIVNVLPFDVVDFSRVQFQEQIYRAELSESVRSGHEVTQVQAKLYEDGAEVDGLGSVTITYKFPSGNEDETFSINQEGVITVRDPTMLDYESLPNIRLIVSAAAVPTTGEGVMFAHSTVYINLQDENDNPPRFAQPRYASAVWEQSDPGTYVLQVSAQDSDNEVNGEVRYYIDHGNVDRAFQVDEITGLVTTALTLDREIHSEYKLIVHAYDLGVPRRTGSCVVKIEVVDINDHTPTLTIPDEGQLSVSEGLEIGSLITTVTANDPDSGSKISFQLSNNDDDLFAIDTHSGNIYLAKSLDYESWHEVTITVSASDGQNTDSRDLILRLQDENDNEPAFKLKSYQASLDELSPVATIVTQVEASDADSNDNGLITYTLIDTLPNRPMFTVDPESGIIRTNMTEAFNPESSIYNLLVMAEDHGSPSLNCTVSVRIQIEDVNDHSPVFTLPSYEASVSEAAERNTHVINVTATDADFLKQNRYINYEITSGNEGGAFRISTYATSGGKSTVGQITVADDLDRELTATYQLTVTAFDQGTPKQSSDTSVLITLGDVNDNQPVFNQSLYEGEIEESARQTPVLQVFASDPDSSSQLMFRITAGNDDSAFNIGECQPTSEGCAQITSRVLDFEEKSEYNLTVQVWDGKNTATARSSVVPVRIHVLDVNEYSPHFAVTFMNKRVPESVGANMTLLRVSAEDRDGGLYGRISYFINTEKTSEKGDSCLPVEEMFKVVRETGEVRTQRPLDYESCQKYSFRIEARGAATDSESRSYRSSGVQPSKYHTIIVQVEVQPIDEEPPVFIGDPGNPYRFKVPYGAGPGHVVGVVNATDGDAGDDGKIVYELDDAESEPEFTINSSSGVITLARSLSGDRILSVTARSGSQSVQTFVSIEITGAPAIALEAQILSIVFGVIAGIAVIIVLLLCIKHRRNKKAQRHRSTGSLQTKSSNGKVGQGGEYYDVVIQPGQTHNGVPVPAPRRATHVINKSSNGKSSSEHQMRRSGSGHTNTTNGYVRQSISTNGRLRALENGSRSKSSSGKVTGSLSNGHTIVNGGLSSTTTNGGLPIPRRRNNQSTSSGRGSEYEDDGESVDREVNQINSSSENTINASSTLTAKSSSKPNIRRKSSGQGRNNKQVPDSGIQRVIRDIDVSSEISDGPNNIKAASVESIHDFGVEGAGEEPLDIRDIEEDGSPMGLSVSFHEQPPNSKSDIIEKNSSYKSPLGTESSKSSRVDRHGVEGSGADLGYKRTHLSDWAPEFQPLATVFSEIARLKDESAARAANHPTFQMKSLGSPRAEPGDSATPPPLITSVADQRNNIVAPVPLGYPSHRHNPVRRGVGGNLLGLYPQSNPQYIRRNNNAPQSVYLPPLYTNPLQNTRPNTSSSGAVPAHLRAPVGFPLPQTSVGLAGLGMSSQNSSQMGLSVSSLPRTPISHESSFTSPAMSPNLSPSLSPLATRSPSVSPLTVGESVLGTTDNEDYTHAPRNDVTTKMMSLTQRERMAHV